MPTLYLAQDAKADKLLATDPLALLVGMLLDQHNGGRMFAAWTSGSSNELTGATFPA